MRIVTTLALALSSIPLSAQVANDSATTHYFVVVAEQLAASAGLGPISQGELGRDDVELRIWGGYGLGGTWGTVARRRNGAWRADAITERQDTIGGPYRGGVRVTANGAWEAVYNFAIRTGLLSLPGLPTRPAGMVYSDGYSVVVQLRTANSYHAWVYDNPDMFRTHADSVILAIADSAGAIAWPRSP